MPCSSVLKEAPSQKLGRALRDGEVILRGTYLLFFLIILLLLLYFIFWPRLAACGIDHFMSKVISRFDTDKRMNFFPSTHSS